MTLSFPPLKFPKGAPLHPEVERHCREISAADGIVIVHPNWWGQPPAILKGWVDRVIRPGVAYRFEEGDKGEGVPVACSRQDLRCVFNTSNTEPQRESRGVRGPPGDALEKLHLRAVRGDNFYRETFGVIVTSTEGERRSGSRQVRDTVRRVFP